MKIIKIVFQQEGGRLRSGWRLLLLLAAIFGGLAATAYALQAAGVPDATADGRILPLPLAFSGFALLACALTATGLLMRLFERRSLATVGLPLSGPWSGGFGAGLGLGALPVALTVAAVLVAGNVEISLGDATLGALFSVTIPVAIGLIFVSSLEEVVLRGYAMQLLAEGSGRWIAAILSGLIFGLAHAENPGANPLGLANTAVNGVLLAWLVMRTGSLWIACGYHAGWNLAGSMGFGMRLSGMDFPGTLLRTELVGAEWLTGGAYGFEGSAVAGVVEMLVLAAAVALAHRLPGHPELRPFFDRLRCRATSARPAEQVTPTTDLSPATAR